MAGLPQASVIQLFVTIFERWQIDEMFFFIFLEFLIQEIYDVVASSASQNGIFIYTIIMFRILPLKIIVYKLKVLITVNNYCRKT